MLRQMPLKEPTNTRSRRSVTVVKPLSSMATVEWNSAMRQERAKADVATQRRMTAMSAARPPWTLRLEPCAMSLELHLRYGAFGGCIEFEELPRREAERSGDHIGREGGDARVVVAHDGVVIAPGVLHVAFYLR